MLEIGYAEEGLLLSPPNSHCEGSGPEPAFDGSDACGSPQHWKIWR